MKASNDLKSLTPTFLSVDFVVRFLTYDCWKSICLCLCYMYLLKNKTQEINYNINVKVKFKTHFQLKFISTIYPHGLITQS